MAIDDRLGSKVGKQHRAEAAPANRVDPYPYIGIVKNNLDPSRTGRVQVWIPDFGGSSEDEKNWRTVSHASPFMGYTETDGSTTTEFDHVPHTYGMWMVPPDIGVQVICVFIAGDPLRGYWIACVNPGVSRHMMPGLAGSSSYNKSNLVDPTLGAKIQLPNKGILYPVAEANLNDPTAYNSDVNLTTIKKPIHEPQMQILIGQGLDKDNQRGAISSSSQRETPSNVFGISTPGRPTKDPADDDAIKQSILNGTYDEVVGYRFANRVRKGGHQFVMDDGSVLGEDQLVRLRTASGHQLIMHDTGNFIYIGHSDGSSWVELTTGGAINVYSDSGVNIRSKENINLYSDSNINIEAKNNLNFKAGNKFKVDTNKFEMMSASIGMQASGKIELKSSVLSAEMTSKISLGSGGKIVIDASSGAGTSTDSGGADKVKDLSPITTFTFPDTAQDSSGLWAAKNGAISSIATEVTTHEPYNRGKSPQYFNIEPTQPEEKSTPSLQKWDQSANRIKEAFAGTTKNATEKELRNQIIDTEQCAPCVPEYTIGPFDKYALIAFFAQMAVTESNMNYSAKNPKTVYVGKYQMGAAELYAQGYITDGGKNSNAKLTQSTYWTGKNGVTNLTKWFEAKALQEEAVCKYAQQNWNYIVANKAVTADMSPAEQMGMLAVSWFGAGNAHAWRLKQIPDIDSYGNNFAGYYQNGRYAYEVLYPLVQKLMNG